MPQIEKPSTTGTVEGFDELNSICNATQFTTILQIWYQQKKLFQRVLHYIQDIQDGAAAEFVCMIQQFPSKAEGGNGES